ncbi:MAG: hypothetical protein L6V93_14880 [Clostridiales bacterium]|nr:MAG: hypothetical protein L6V93_14880 [Clostridiales bacterium]
MQDKQSGKYAVLSNGTKDTITYFFIRSIRWSVFVPFATIAVEADVKKLLNSSSNPSYNGNFYICTEDGDIIGGDAKKNENARKIADEYGIERGVKILRAVLL